MCVILFEMLHLVNKHRKQAPLTQYSASQGDFSSLPNGTQDQIEKIHPR